MAAIQIDADELLKRLDQLEARVRALEAGARVPASPLATAVAPVSTAATALAPAPPEALPEDVLTVISAAIAAFLGVKAQIKQVRLVGREGWAQQGRASIMASHRLAGRG
jgi:methylmalonyl-CoA carboxyltransferase large subunit